MIAPYFTGGKLRYILKLDDKLIFCRFATKNGVTDTGLAVEAYIDTCAIPYREFSEEWISKDYTPIYEWCSSTNPIVLQYQKDALTLIALRNMTTGKYLSYNDTVENAKSKGISNFANQILNSRNSCRKIMVTTRSRNIKRKSIF